MDNNIPAYPLPATEQHIMNQSPLPAQQGMTLLDYFAGLALPYCQSRIDAKNNPENAAHYAYRQAASMLEARKEYIK